MDQSRYLAPIQGCVWCSKYVVCVCVCECVHVCFLCPDLMKQSTKRLPCTGWVPCFRRCACVNGDLIIVLLISSKQTCSWFWPVDSDSLILLDQWRTREEDKTPRKERKIPPWGAKRPWAATFWEAPVRSRHDHAARLKPLWLVEVKEEKRD